ncbi:hypothetical protein IW261DRAFT_1509589 [Armillaria novae-zelandiae]|uniref:Uncharacterized protein n=1 Tax=Armillaria novae-zelandiae TaxID=153914 RepID=A0AA39T8Q9_9AGAR|nr:hypothetical protein IW261DRAFT_1509589 [Armillaria novae-zelandiae]
MSQFLHSFRRSSAEGPILNNGTYSSYGSTEAALAGGHNIETRNRLLDRFGIREAQGIALIGQIILILFTLIPFVLICIAIPVALLSTGSGAWLVIGHWLLLHLSTPPNPNLYVSFWSTFLVGFWGSMAAFLPFSVLSISLKFCVIRASDRASRILEFVLGALWVGVDSAAGVPLVRHYYGIETLGIEYAVGAAYTSGAVCFFLLIVSLLCMFCAL